MGGRLAVVFGRRVVLAVVDVILTGNLGCPKISTPSHLASRGFCRQNSSIHRGSVRRLVMQSGGQLACTGLLLHGQRLSIPVFQDF